MEGGAKNSKSPSISGTWDRPTQIRDRTLKGFRVNRFHTATTPRASQNPSAARPPGRCALALANSVYTASKIHSEVADKTRAIACGAIGANPLLVRKIGLAEAIDVRLHLLKHHLPCHESDHVLTSPTTRWPRPLPALGSRLGAAVKVATQTTKPPKRRSLSRRVSWRRRDWSPPVAPLLPQARPITRGRRLGKEAGGHLAGEATEAVADLNLDPSEAGGSTVQAVEQPWLHVIDLRAQRRRDLGQRGDDRAGLGLIANLHVRLAGEGEQTVRRPCYRDPQLLTTSWESARLTPELPSNQRRYPTG